ncbi:hypothetical protein [Paracoccus sp. TOH]|uniref:hypothetical protein n=1 Tax=Paracoccus sp. TOH TaxID=1263728 RepID=UPI0025B05BE2|nr:hypothetical protein [Paracoccus sp. TOH]WJS87095.1 hypothetical protein NBE95_20885 [Paracoccus sp. TOH]
METLNAFFNLLNGIVWGVPMIALLIGNLISLPLLSLVVIKLTRDYFAEPENRWPIRPARLCAPVLPAK